MAHFNFKESQMLFFSDSQKNPILKKNLYSLSMCTLRVAVDVFSGEKNGRHIKIKLVVIGLKMLKIR